MTQNNTGDLVKGYAEWISHLHTAAYEGVLRSILEQVGHDKDRITVFIEQGYGLDGTIEQRHIYVDNVCILSVAFKAVIPANQDK